MRLEYMEQRQNASFLCLPNRLVCGYKECAENVQRKWPKISCREMDPSSMIKLIRPEK